MSVLPDVTPSHYTDGVSINWSINSDVDSLISVVNGIPPAISKYIAYDNLTPANPFIAVTQDGKGNVVYDGGFPKFYNTRLSNNTGPGFDGLYPSFKFLHNAFNFIANPAKQRKLLVLNDQVEGGSYHAKSSFSSGFKNALEYVADIAGFSIVIKDPNDYGGVIDARLAELEEYAGLVIMGTNSSDNFNIITAASVQDIVTFRSNGGGMVLITDHGTDLTSIDEASQPHTGFFTFTNRIAVNFGAYFTGDFDRSPVNVGFLRQNYGDHPLYSGLSDSEDILAGGSESKVVVTEVETYGPSNQPTTIISEAGINIINFLIIKTDGSVSTERYCFFVGETDFLQISDVGINKGNRLFQTIFSGLDLNMVNSQGQLGTLTGHVVYQDGTTGTVSISDEGVIDWSETPIMEQPDDYLFTINIASPFKYTSQQTVRKINLPNNITSPAELFSFIRREVSEPNTFWEFTKHLVTKTGTNPPNTLTELLAEMRSL